MVRTRSPINAAELLPSDQQIPEGTKEVRRTTVERFIEPVESGERTDAEELQDLDPADPEQFQLDDSLLADEEIEELQPRERFLRELGKQLGGSTGPLTFYARRKADPPGMTFRTPCNAETAAGDVPYSDDDLCWEALELSIQKLYGGGRYQVIVREGGKYLGARTVHIADAPERRADPAAATTGHQPPVQQQPSFAKSPLDEARSSIEFVKEVAAMFKPTEPPRSFQPPPAPDPIENLRNAVTLVKEFQSVSPSNGGGGNEGGERSTVRDWTEGIASIGREFGVGQLLNNIFVAAMRANERKQAQDAAGQGGPTPAQEAPASQPPSPATKTPLHAVPSPSQPAAGFLPGGFSLEQLPPPIRTALDQALSTLVAEIHASEASDPDDPFDADIATSALEGFLETYPMAAPIFEQLLSQSSIRVVLFLSNVKPEWSNLPDLQCGAGFIDEVKAWWLEGKENSDAEPPQPDADDETVVNPGKVN